MQRLNSEDLPAWVGVARLILAAIIAIGGVSLTYCWGSTGYTVAAWVCAFATIGGLAGLYPGEPEKPL